MIASPKYPETRVNLMTNQSGVDGLLRAVREYFDLMYDSDVSRFDRVFRPTAQLHGLRNGKMRMLTAQAYRELLATAPSPQSQGAPRQEEMLFLDITSATQALVKVRVRIGALVYVTTSGTTAYMVNGSSARRPSRSRATWPPRDGFPIEL
jgi:hypothetical protein